MRRRKKDPARYAPPEEVIDFESLYESAWVCRRGVAWKPSTKHFTLNAIEETLKMEARLASGTWKNGIPKPISITYPKKRDGLSIPFRDRVYQRSLNDKSLYPAMTKSFIYDNCACQTGKGTDFARNRVKHYLMRHYRKYGLTGFVVEVDVHGYYPTMRHSLIEQTFGEHVDDKTLRMAMDVLENQYSGDIGCNPGSQMVQIAGISVLNRLDHYIKEQLHVKAYVRYMDDFWMVLETEERAKEVMDAVVSELAKIGFEANAKKTRIFPLKNGFMFLGFFFRMTATGKIIMTLDPANVERERRKLRRMAKLVKCGRVSRAKYFECYFGWRASASKGNTKKLLMRMDAYAKSLVARKEGKQNGIVQTKGTPPERGEGS